MTPRILCCAFAATGLFTLNGHAAPGDATRLEYARSERAAACPDGSALQDAVQKRLGYNPFFPAARQTIAVEITASDTELRAGMQLIDEAGIIRGSRKLSERAEHCDELVASLALAISIALDPSAALGSDPKESPTAGGNDGDAMAMSAAKANTDTAPVSASPPPQAVPATTEAATTQRVPPTKKQSTRNPHPLPIEVRAGAFTAFGAAPATAFGWRADVGAHAAWFKILAEFTDQFPASSNVLGASARASLVAGSLVGCFAPSAFAACALGRVGAFRSVGAGIINPSSQTSVDAALGARLEYAPTLYRSVHLLLQVDALKSLTPITLRLRNEDAWHTPPLSVALGLGLALQFQ